MSYHLYFKIRQPYNIKGIIWNYFEDIDQIQDKKSKALIIYTKHVNKVNPRVCNVRLRKYSITP
jgi:hypothetical protein